MKVQIISVITEILAAIIVMILHEVPKTLVYYAMDHNTKKESLWKMIYLHHYIDPIGVVLGVTSYGAFSRPYLYRMKDQKTNKVLGMVGFLSLVVVYFSTFFILKTVFLLDHTLAYNANMGDVRVFLIYLCLNIALMSFGMFVVNLFPIATFDMSNFVFGRKKVQLFDLLKQDYLLKTVLLFILLFNLIAGVNTMFLQMMLR